MATRDTKCSNSTPGNSRFLAFAVAIRRISQINILRFRGVVSEYQVAHCSFLMTSKTSFHNGFVCCLSLQLDHFMPGTSTQLGLRRVRVAFNAKPLYFLASALRHEKAKKPIPQLASKRRKNQE